MGLLLWKIRKTLQASTREYEILVADDGSTGATAEILEPYTKALPLTVVRHGERHGYARSVEELLRLAVERTVATARGLADLSQTTITVSTQPPGAPTNLTASSTVRRRVDVRAGPTRPPPPPPHW